MNTSKMRAITVIANISHAKDLPEQLLGWGAEVCHVTESLKPATRLRPINESDAKQIRIEVVANDTAADRILCGLHDEYSHDSSMVYFVSDVVASAPSLSRNSSSRAPHLPREMRWGDYLITI